MTGRRRARFALVVLGVLPGLVLAGCSSDDDGESTSVFSAKPGQCFVAPAEVEAQISDLDRVDCGESHDHEAYAVVPYVATGAEESSEESSDEFPGDEVLTNFAEGACAERFREYVGVDYLDSELYFTYLLPSPRSWQEDDRSVLCLITAAGGDLQGSVKGSER